MAILLAGIVVTAASWTIAWAGIDGLSEFSFFPLWIGYILLINGASDVFFNMSLLRSMGRSFLWLFAISVPLWWFFESLNKIVKNWQYVFPYPISDTRYVIEASIDFSTVLPAVLSTTILFHHVLLRWRIVAGCKPTTVRKSNLVLAVLLGLLSFCLVVLFPREAFPLVWIAPILLLEPIAYAAGFPSWLREIEKGECLLPVSIMTATMFNGFCWELWNFYSLPKWIYDVPYVGFWHVFEMPILGYLEYPLFGLFVFSYATSVLLLTCKQDILPMFVGPVQPRDGTTV
jgi:hypothetical protein